MIVEGSIERKEFIINIKRATIEVWSVKKVGKALFPVCVNVDTFCIITSLGKNNQNADKLTIKPTYQRMNFECD